jgi:hypothetical protein
MGKKDKAKDKGKQAKDKKMSSISSVVLEFFKENSWAVSQVGEETVWQLAFQGEKGKWSCLAQTGEAEQQFAFYSISPINVPPEKLATVAELLYRINLTLTVGNFELNFDTGEVFFKTSIDVEGDRLTTALVARLVINNVMAMDYYLPALMSVISSEVSAKAALEEFLRQEG